MSGSKAIFFYYITIPLYVSLANLFPLTLIDFFFYNSSLKLGKNSGN